MTSPVSFVSNPCLLIHDKHDNHMSIFTHNPPQIPPISQNPQFSGFHQSISMDDDDDHDRSPSNSLHLPSPDPSPAPENPIAEQQDKVSCDDLAQFASKNVTTDSAMVRLRGSFEIFWDERRLMARDGNEEEEESCGGG
ncbi:hypothetical protein Drorol1_Dr00003611 [Drosera rotundifolia]